MKKILPFLLLSLILVSCKSTSGEEEPTSQAVLWEPYDESAELEEQAHHENERLRFKLINSKFLDKNSIWEPFTKELADFSEEKYNDLKPLILEKDIPTLQRSIQEDQLSYTDLTLFYLYRIRKFESDNDLSLNALIALNPEVINKAKELDRKQEDVSPHSVYGMPILLKDNISTDNMPTTAGAIALAENQTATDAFIVERLKAADALILGKVNLSEWAYYFCEGCPLGYSAVGGQTLNPYGRKQFETGGSSSGSGVAVAANYAVAAVGTETSGSILSPSSLNSVVGLKPTLGLLSRTGIIPISSTLDTPGPMTKFVVDNAILLKAMTGQDFEDEASIASDQDYIPAVENATLEGKRVGVMRSLLSDSLYSKAVDEIRAQGADVVTFDPLQVKLDGFGTLLDVDMKQDLPEYISQYGNEDLRFRNIEDIVSYNRKDSLLRAPYGQGLFEGILEDTTTAEELDQIKSHLEEEGRRFFDEPMKKHQLDLVLSINNYHAGYAAVAKYPAITVPMGYSAEGEPKGLTFIAGPYQEAELLQSAAAFENASKARKAPANYQ